MKHSILVTGFKYKEITLEVENSVGSGEKTPLGEFLVIFIFYYRARVDSNVEVENSTAPTCKRDVWVNPWKIYFLIQRTSLQAGIFQKSEEKGVFLANNTLRYVNRISMI